MFKLDLDCGKHVAFNLTEEQVKTLLGHDNVMQYVAHIGLKNILQDSHASVVRDDFKTDEEWIAAKRAKAELKLGALMNGEVRTSRGERAPRVDDFTNFARKFVLRLLSKEKRKALAELPDKGAEKLDAAFAANEAKWRPMVQKELDDAIAKSKAMAEMASEVEIDI